MRKRKKDALLTPSRIFLYGVLIKNPVLVQVIGLCPAVAAAADIYVSAILSAMVTGLLILCECIASLLLKKVPGRVRVAVYFLLSLVVCAETSILLDQYAPDLVNRIGVYLPLMAASSVVALRAENFAVTKSVRLSFLDALANGVGTSIVLLVSGFVRGLLGSGKIGDYTVFAVPPLRGLAMPFGGFLVLGFSAAFLKWFISVFLEQYDSRMEFGIRRAAKKPTVTPVRQTAAAPVSASAPQQAPKPPQEDEQSRAAAFYEQASEDPQENLDKALFDAGELSVQEELDAILAGIDSFEEIQTQIRRDEDA